MSRVIAEILEHPERAVSKVIERLEAKNGYPSHDVRHYAQNLQKSRLKIAELNLDPDDTTAEELYRALLIKFQNDARRFDEHFGLHLKDYDDKIARAVELVSNNAELPDRWVLKAAAAKSLLRQHPPKRLMKRLHYRSLESMLKREKLGQLYLGIEFIESVAWNKAHFKLASSLESTAFERRRLQLEALGLDKWGVESWGQIGVSSNDYGALGIVPQTPLAEASLLSLVVQLLDDLSMFSDVKTSRIAAGLSPAAAWWSETDALVIKLGGNPVSFNLKDLTDNHLSLAEFNQHSAVAGQKSFWKDLLARYENQLAIEEDLLPRLENKMSELRLPMNQPAFEYVEDI